MQLKGTTMLKVTGILYIVFAALQILMGLMMLFGGGLLSSAGVQAGAYFGAGFGGIIAFAGIFMILGSALGLVTGILGVKFCRRPDKAQVCFVLGIVLIVFAGLSLVGSFGNENSSTLSALVGLVLPILYTVGAYWNKESAKYQQYQQPGYQYGQQPPMDGSGAPEEPHQNSGPEL